MLYITTKSVILLEKPQESPEQVCAGLKPGLNNVSGRTTVKTIPRTLVAGIFVAAVAVWVLPLHADLLSESGSYAYTDSGNVTWAGSTTYTDLGLTGSVEWVVFGPGKFAQAFPSASATYSPPANELVYAYQIVNTGTSGVSSLGVQFEAAGRQYDTDGWFSIPGDSGDASPLSQSFALALGDVTFDSLFSPDIMEGFSSAGLAFASPDVPEGDFASLVNSGLGASANPTPGPSTVTVPEPSALILLVAGAVLMGLRRGVCRRRA